MADSVIRFLFKGDAKGAQDAFKQMGAAAGSLDRPPAATPVGPTRPASRAAATPPAGAFGAPGTCRALAVGYNPRAEMTSGVQPTMLARGRESHGKTVR